MEYALDENVATTHACRRHPVPDAPRCAGAVQDRSRAGCDSASLRQRSSVCVPTPISRATSSTERLGNLNAAFLRGAL